MKLKEFEIYSYKLPTSLGFIREGLIVRLIDEHGNEGIGEIAPLPGRSPETLNDALNFTKSLKEKFLKQDFTPALFPPSVMLGMEMAISSLLFPLKEDLPFQLTRLTANPIPGELAVKVKLKEFTLKEAIDKSGEFIASGSKIRLDLNRSWDLKQTIEFCSHFRPSDFVYIEEPVSIFSDLEKFYDATSFPYALDEHLLEHPLERIKKLRGLSHLIIKPTLHGGLHRCKEIVNEAKNLTCVFSSAYETGVGLSHIALIGATLNPDHPIGIDTHSIFEEDILPFNPHERVLKKELYQKMPILWNKLQRVG